MEAKLIKNKYGDDFYYLMVGIDTYATTHKESFRRLSLKNCQAIELGYDLDELAKASMNKINILFNNSLDSKSHTIGFKAGWHHALKILGDKKFSEEDIKKAILLSMKYNDVGVIQSLQQTEWDVEVEMEYVGECNGNNGEGCFQDSPGHNCGCFEIKPKLDADGCLILKRK